MRFDPNALWQRHQQAHPACGLTWQLRRLWLQPGCSAVCSSSSSGLRTGLQWRRCSVPSAPPCMHRPLHPASSFLPPPAHCHCTPLHLTWCTLQDHTTPLHNMEKGWSTIARPTSQGAHPKGAAAMCTMGVEVVQCFTLLHVTHYSIFPLCRPRVFGLDCKK